PHKKITIELRSLNSKRFDMYSRLPSVYREKEIELHKIISQSLGRGKIDFSLQLENTGGQTSTAINHAVVRNYMESLKAVSQTDMHDELELLKMAITLP